MPAQFDHETLEELSKGKNLKQLESIFNNLIDEIVSYIKLKPLYEKFTIELNNKNLNQKDYDEEILDFGVRRVVNNNNLTIIFSNKYLVFLPFLLLREVYYSFLPIDMSEVIKVCINQIIENDLNQLSYSKEWKKIIRDALVKRDFSKKLEQFDKMQKFFKIEAKEPFEDTIQFFFKYLRENLILIKSGNVKEFYERIFNQYTYKTSKSIFNNEIIETIRVLISLREISNNYITLADYYSLFSKKKNDIKPSISLRQFKENLKWINKCSAIAPSYDTFYGRLGLCAFCCFLKFHPLIEKSKIKKLLEQWQFYHSPKFTENAFATEISLIFWVPKIYLNDLLNYFEKLEIKGYLIDKEIYYLLDNTNFLNLNYFIDPSNTKKIIDPNFKEYNKKNEIEHKIEYDIVPYSYPLTLFEFLILDRIRYLSVTGLTFDKRIETLNAVKDDIENELRKQKKFINEFKTNFNSVMISSELKDKFLQFIEKNQSIGFFETYHRLEILLTCLKILETEVWKQNLKASTHLMQKYIEENTFSKNLEINILLKNKYIREALKKFITRYFNSPKTSRNFISEIQKFYNILNSCFNLKIFNLSNIGRIIKDNLVEDIFNKKTVKIENLKKSTTLYKITNQKIESTIESFLSQDPPIIKPYLINTIITSAFAKYYPIFVIIDNKENRERLENLKSYFPRIFIYKMSEFTTKADFIYILFYLVNLKEKKLLITALYNIFKESIHFLKRYFWRGVVSERKFLLRDFYDFENNEFFYTDDLFNELYNYSLKILGDKLEWPNNQINENLREYLWPKNKSFNDLVKKVKKRIYHQEIDFNVNNLNNLLEFQKNLESTILNNSKFREIKNKPFFKKYVKSIKLIPLFSNFGFSNYFLYIQPFDYNFIDFKLLSTNSFQEIKYPASIDSNQIIYYSYIFPHRKPNKTYLNWLIKSKKNISEYCLFYKKKIYELMNFNRNLTKLGWDYSSIRFKSYVENVLFDRSYNPKFSNIKEFNLDSINLSDIFYPESQEFNALTHIYNTYSIDIKSYLGTKKYTTIDQIKYLLKRKLIFPYLSLKNLDFEEKILIILPNIMKKFNEELIKIFSFFNLCHIYEIEGEFFIYGFEDIKQFENGLLIEIWFPKCELDEFFEVFDLIFEYFKIKHYLILTDLVDGKHLLKSVYGNLKFLEEYNPLKNLIWNDKDKIWMNHKLFNEKFEPFYPDLIYGNKKEET
ncbi:MAG: hypothetical protein ACFFA8_05190 [Promethearchaeota archaeon]